MELYQAYTDYQRDDGPDREPVPFCGSGGALGPPPLLINGVEMDLGKPFARITMVDAVKNIPELILTRFIPWRKPRLRPREKGSGV